MRIPVFRIPTEFFLSGPFDAVSLQPPDLLRSKLEILVFKKVKRNLSRRVQPLKVKYRIDNVNHY